MISDKRAAAKIADFGVCRRNGDAAVSNLAHWAGPIGSGPMEIEFCEHLVTNATKNLDPPPPFSVTRNCVTKHNLTAKPPPLVLVIVTWFEGHSNLLEIDRVWLELLEFA